MEKCGTAATGTFNACRVTQFMTITFTFHIQSKRNFSTTTAIGNFSIPRKDGRCGNVANFWHYRGCYNLQVISRLVMQCNGNGLSELWQSKQVKNSSQTNSEQFQFGHKSILGGLFFCFSISFPPLWFDFLLENAPKVPQMRVQVFNIEQAHKSNLKRDKSYHFGNFCLVFLSSRYLHRQLHSNLQRERLRTP